MCSSLNCLLAQILALSNDSPTMSLLTDAQLLAPLLLDCHSQAASSVYVQTQTKIELCMVIPTAALACLLSNMTQMLSLQDAESNWQFDIFGFAEACSGASLSMLGFHLYKQAGMIRDFKLDEQKLCNWLQRIESGYDANNPYHNRCAFSAPIPPNPHPCFLTRISLPTCHVLLTCC